jgi:hypothetical protein
MDNSNLFSHPEAPEYVASQASGKPVEYPAFSDRPDAGADVAATRLLSQP